MNDDSTDTTNAIEDWLKDGSPDTDKIHIDEVKQKRLCHGCLRRAKPNNEERCPYCGTAHT